MQLSPQEQTYRKNAQKLDEESFKRYFQKKGFTCEKLDIKRGKFRERRPDFLVSRANLKAVFELKSLFRDNEWLQRDEVWANIHRRLEMIELPFRYSLDIEEFTKQMDLDGFVEHVKLEIITYAPTTHPSLVIHWNKPRMTFQLLAKHNGKNLKFLRGSEVYGTGSTSKRRVTSRIDDAFIQLKAFKNLPCVIVIYKNTTDLDEDDIAEVAYGDYRFELDPKTHKFVNSYFANNQTFSKDEYADLSAIVLAKRIGDDTIEKVKFTVYDNPTKPLPKEFFDET